MKIAMQGCDVDLDDHHGGIGSVRAQTGRDVLSEAEGRVPLFAAHYMERGRSPSLRSITSAEARSCVVEQSTDGKYDLCRLLFEGFPAQNRRGSLELQVEARIRYSASDRLSYWSLAVTAGTGIVVTQVHFPQVALPYRTPYGPVRVAVPYFNGLLYTDPGPADFLPDSPQLWELGYVTPRFGHYPGTTFSQFLAWYDGDTGIYLGCHDATGAVKVLRPVHNDAGLRLGIGHVVGWSGCDRADLGYEVAFGLFEGNWRDAADIYKSWYTRARPEVVPLESREDVPEWMLEQPLHVVLRIQGDLDEGPTGLHEDFTPYEKALPALDSVAGRVDAPLVAVIMGWEKGGPWVYPESLPPVGGTATLQAFTAGARARGWHVGTYCNGTQWVTAHHWAGYDGRAYFDHNRGQDAVCAGADGRPLTTEWDVQWRSSHPCCIAAERTREVATDFVTGVRAMGLDWIQFLDQNCGAASFPCYSSEHGHPPAPGNWMTAHMESFLESLAELSDGGPERGIYSVECPPNDFFLNRFLVCDLRFNYEPIDRVRADIPLFTYLFHEYILVQSVFAPAPNPFWMQLKVARAFVMGELLGAMLQSGGRLRNWAGEPWVDWSAPYGDQGAIFTLLKRAVAVRRGAGRPFLVNGRLLPDQGIEEGEEIEWVHDGRLHRAKPVYHARWIGSDGRTAIALANWTSEDHDVGLQVTNKSRVEITADNDTEIELPASSRRRLSMPPLSVALVFEC